MLIARRTLYTVSRCLRLVNDTSSRVFFHSLRQWQVMKRSSNGDVMLRHLRYREKLGRELDPPASIELSVIGSGVNGTPKSFVINTDHIR